PSTLLPYTTLFRSDPLGLLVGALHEANPRAQRVEPLQIGFAAIERGLQHDAELPRAVMPERVEDLERHIGGGRTLHVDPDEESLGLGALEDLPQVVDGDRLVDVKTELGELQRDIAFDARA